MAQDLRRTCYVFNRPIFRAALAMLTMLWRDSRTGPPLMPSARESRWHGMSVRCLVDVSSMVSRLPSQRRLQRSSQPYVIKSPRAVPG